MTRLNTINTNRCKLRCIRPSDNQRVFEILKDAETTRYLNIKSINSLSDVDELIHDYLAGYKVGQKYPFAIIEKEIKQLIGVFIIKLDIYDEDCFEFTVFIDKKYWNNGIYSEVLPEMLRFSFECLGTGSVRGFVMQGNPASSKVLKKQGFSLEKVFRVEGLPELIESYLMTRGFYFLHLKQQIIID